MLAAGGHGDRLADGRLEQVEGQRAMSDHRHRRRIDQRKQAAQPEAERLAGLAECLALRAVIAPRPVGECGDVGIA